jgi:3'-phosphoadenosine 5'-phosphosulfate sulfotransferase (PAPS reductase)/FAD synthetase
MEPKVKYGRASGTRKPNKLTYQEVRQKQSLDLDQKVTLTKERIREFYEYFKGQIYVCFSGGKDSTVVLHLVRSLYPEVPAVYVDTGLDYPEVKEFIKTIDNVTWLRPKKSFYQVLQDYGYPVISSRISGQLKVLQNPREGNAKTREILRTGKNSLGKPTMGAKFPKKYEHLVNAPFKFSNECCHVMKIATMNKYKRETGRKPVIAIMAAESFQRTIAYIRRGCNVYEGYNVASMPIFFWNEKDIWDYIKKYNVPYCKIYDMGYKRTGCIFCMFGILNEKEPNRFQKMKQDHPELYNYCMNQLQLQKILELLKVPYK